MTHIILRLASFLPLLFAAVLTVIHAQPYDAGDLRESLAAPERCAAPCFMNIRPGETLATDAFDMLERHPWVANVDLYVDFNTLAWDWSGSQPDWIDGSQQGMLWLHHNVVQYIKFKTFIPFGDMFLMTATQPHSALRPLKRSSVDSSRRFSYLIAFRVEGDALPQQDFLIESYLPCDMTTYQRWNAPVWLKIAIDARRAEIDPTIALVRSNQAECRGS